MSHVTSAGSVPHMSHVTSAGSVPHMSHVTSCTPTKYKCNIFAKALATGFRELGLKGRLSLQFPNIISIPLASVRQFNPSMFETL
jgi:hypothetical protein